MNFKLSTIFFYVFFAISFNVFGLNPGKMIITGFRGTSPTQKQVIELKQKIDEKKIGGIILFKRNIVNKQQLVELVQFLKKDTPIFVAIDHEGGIVNRLTHSSFNLKTPSPERFCKLEPKQQLSIAHTISDELTSLGINTNLGGVVDIAPLIESSSICQYKRCFGDSETIISQCNQVLFNAHNKKNVFFALKHFPGHGSTPVDSHYFLPDISKNHTGHDYMPYYNLINDNKSPYIMVMIGHLMDKNVDSKYPASLSKSHIDILKKQLRFNGLIITDDLNMGALYNISKNKSVIAKQAALAGNDLLLYEYLSLNDIEKINQTLLTSASESSELRANILNSESKINKNLALNAN